MDRDKKLNLVLEGGGVKGIGLIGAIEEFEKQGYTWASIGGTSAGAIVATLLAVGYTGEELHRKLLDPKLDFVEIMDHVSIRQDFFRLLSARGLLKATKIFGAPV